MLKIRLMGTKSDIAWFQNKGTRKYYRAYAQVQKVNLKKDN